MSGVQTRFVERIMQSSAHILFTARAKTEWATDRVGEGKLEGRRVGLAPVQKEGLEYEPDLFFDMTSDHRLILSKSRVYDWPGLETGATFVRPGNEFADLVIAWAQDGVPRVDELADALAAAVAASVDRPSYDDARKGLTAWMVERGIPKTKADTTLAAFNRRVRIARGAAA